MGGYQLLTRLGEGGMGVVHLARRADGDRVALKVLRPHIVGDDEARRRLAREVDSLSRVRSPRVAEIVDADPWGDIPFVATRYVPGLSLDQEVREEGPVTGPDLVWLASCLAEALAAVHAVGVLHRDVKPSNVVMEGRTPILIDFGLARVADDSRITHTGWLLGTPGYLAPEILYGEDATTASDVHSWAATVAFAGTGRPPFGRGPSMAVMDRVRRGEHDLSGLDPAVRDLLEAALAPEPAHRPTLPEVRRRLESLDARRGSDRRGSGPRPTSAFPVTMPYAAAAPAPVPGHDQVDRTDLVGQTSSAPVAADDVVRPTGVLGDDGSIAVLPEDDDYDDLWTTSTTYDARPRAGLLERVRRALLVSAGATVVAGGIALAPYVTLAGLTVLSWLLRSGSRAGSAVGQRRQLRGRRWYDAPALLLATPWHLVAALPGTLMLVLWSLGIAAATGLVCFALALGLTESLGVVGFAFGLGMWWGPGSTRVRGPVRRVTDPVAARPVAWLLVTVMVLAGGAGLGAAAVSEGTRWTPDDTRPFADVRLPSWLKT
ncbi:hypothetical protein DDE18_18275 [Nocardioides gansuensis]|uniref:non-specific serine/threonine protein kinase n=1 Tax=Nocardioides gansuensis TaxID=2138300 RepID=A0A2T8F6U4_9ACTN|nr:hypothetical protein DDE18_18275 [Nocardioides gansuensis]